MSFIGRVSAAAAIVAVTLPSIASATTIYNATFEGLTVGGALSTGTPPSLPSSIDPNLTATVEDASSVGGAALTTGNFARLSENPGEAPNVAFDNGISYDTGIVTVSMDLLFESLDNYQIVFREGSGVGGAAIKMADIDFSSSGQIRFESNGALVTTSPYAAGTAMSLRTVFDLDNDTWDAFLDGVPVVTGATIFDEPLGLVGVGFQFSGFTPSPGAHVGVMQLDNYRFSAQTVAEPVTAGLLAFGLIGLMRRRAR